MRNLKTKQRLEYIFKNLGIYVGEIKIDVGRFNLNKLIINSDAITLNTISIDHVFYNLDNSNKNKRVYKGIIELSIKNYFNLENELCLN